LDSPAKQQHVRFHHNNQSIQCCESQLLARYWLNNHSIRGLYFFRTIEYLLAAGYLDDQGGGESDMTMTDYRKRAEECIEIAQTARTPAQRTMLLHIAET
jgi:hypothetical protein